VKLLNIFNQDWNRQNELVALTRIKKYQHGVKEQLFFNYYHQFQNLNILLESHQANRSKLINYKSLHSSKLKIWKVLPCTTPP
jgi:hypothetical protein